MSLEARVTPHIAPSGLEVSELERQLRDKLKEAMQLQGRWDAEKVELNSRILELADMVKHLRAQNSEKDTGLAAMQTSLDRMETSRAEDRAEMDDFLSEINILQKVLTSITQLVHGGEDGNVSGGQPSSSSSSPLRGRTPQCNSTLMAVKGLLSQHQIQTQDLRSRLDAALEQVDILHRNLQEQEEERRDLEGRMKEVQKENQQVERSLEEKHRDNQRFHTSLDLLNSEKVSLEKLVVGLQQKTESLGAELEVMRGSAGDLQRQRDLLRQQRDDLERQLERQRSEAQRGPHACVPVFEPPCLCPSPMPVSLCLSPHACVPVFEPPCLCPCVEPHACVPVLSPHACVPVFEPPCLCPCVEPPCLCPLFEPMPVSLCLSPHACVPVLSPHACVPVFEPP
ncbi:putative ciliary rootlet coiled-coil protein 2 [Salvelinus namaycush]|uniref:Ciliary rootlet coiled-coil protein 2 n=1 Tax=Salvelinus namaycush TaxID=8040 RepID=A0A8U0QG14_SALNM|nr:putative ciliary rootlet coiled-coil protein 2 [Salvelinus namaycush]